MDIAAQEEDRAQEVEKHAEREQMPVKKKSLVRVKPRINS